MEARDKQREVPASVGRYSKHLGNGCITADTGAEVWVRPAVTLQLMCVDSADVIYSSSLGPAVLTNELPGTQQIMHAAQAHHERLLGS